MINSEIPLELMKLIFKNIIDVDVARMLTAGYINTLVKPHIVHWTTLVTLKKTTILPTAEANTTAKEVPRIPHFIVNGYKKIINKIN
jgi:hypothetical protein